MTEKNKEDLDPEFGGGGDPWGEQDEDEFVVDAYKKKSKSPGKMKKSETERVVCGQPSPHTTHLQSSYACRLPKFWGIVRKIHTSEKSVNAENNYAIVEKFITLYFNPKDTTILSEYAFHRLCPTYRFGTCNNKNSYYKLNKCRWEVVTNLSQFHHSVIKMYKETIRKIIDEITTREVCQNRLPDLEKWLKQFDTSEYVNKVRKYAKEAFEIEENYESYGLTVPSEFGNSLDKNGFLLGFNNGIYDLKNFKFYTENEIPSDFHVSMTVGFDFPRETNPEHLRQRDEIKKLFFDKVFASQMETETDEFESRVAPILGQFLEGRNYSKILPMFISKYSGSGKTMLTHLLMMTLGQYAIKWGITTLTNPSSDPNSCNKHVYSGRKCRIVCITEPPGDKKFNIEYTKQITGDDGAPGRNGHDSYKFEPVFHPTLLIVGNHYNLKGADEAFLERIRIIFLNSRFKTEKDVDDDSEKYLFIKDNTLASKIESYKQGTMLLLLKWHKDYYVLKNNREIPQIPSDIEEEDVASSEISEDNSQLFKDHLKLNYVSTDKSNWKLINEESDLKHLLSQTKDIIKKFKNESGKVISTSKGMSIIKENGYDHQDTVDRTTPFRYHRRNIVYVVLKEDFIVFSNKSDLEPTLKSYIDDSHECQIFKRTTKASRQYFVAYMDQIEKQLKIDQVSYNGPIDIISVLEEMGFAFKSRGIFECECKPCFYMDPLKFQSRFRQGITPKPKLQEYKRKIITENRNWHGEQDTSEDGKSNESEDEPEERREILACDYAEPSPKRPRLTYSSQYLREAHEPFEDHHLCSREEKSLGYLTPITR